MAARPFCRRLSPFRPALPQRALRVRAQQQQQQVTAGQDEERWDAQVTEGKVGFRCRRLTHVVQRAANRVTNDAL